MSIRAVVLSRLVCLGLLVATSVSSAAISPAAPFGARFDRLHTSSATALSLGLKKIQSLNGISNDGYRFDLLNAKGDSLLRLQGPYENVIRGFVAARIFHNRVFIFSRNQLLVLTRSTEGFVLERKIAMKSTTELDPSAQVAKGSVSANQRFIVYAEPMAVNEIHPFQRLRLTAVEWATGALVESKIVLGSKENVERIGVTDEGHIQIVAKN